MSFIGVDVGTGGCKAILLGKDKKILGSAARDYSLQTPQPGWAELDPWKVLNAVKSAIREIAHVSSGDPVQAISVSSMGDTITPCDEKGDPIANSILAFDTRNILEADLFEEEFSRLWVFERTGQPIHPTYSITKILWIKRHMPDLFKQTAKYLCYEDFITCQLCGEAAISFSSAARIMAFDINTFDWNSDLLAFAGINDNKLANPVQSGIPLGPIKKNLAMELGLPDNVKVISGGHDQPCGSLGCGFSKNDFAIDSTGTVEVLLVSQNKPVLTEDMLEANICFWPHVIEDRYCACGQILTAGAAFRWYRDLFFGPDEGNKNDNSNPSYEYITNQFSDQHSNLFFIPHLAGCGTPEFLPAAKGAFFGLTLQTDKYQIAKSIIEGVCFEMKLNINLLEHAGIAIKGMRSIGGAAKSAKWMQMKADIFDLKIEACQFVNQCPLGASYLAAYGTGYIKDLNETVGFIDHEIKEFAPVKDEAYTYSEKFREYLRFRSSIFDLYEKD